MGKVEWCGMSGTRLGHLSALDYIVCTDSYKAQTYVRPRCDMSMYMSRTRLYIHLTDMQITVIMLCYGFSRDTNKFVSRNPGKCRSERWMRTG